MPEDYPPSGTPQPRDGAASLARFQAAFSHHQRGQLAQADALYCELLARVPDHPDGLHFRGVLLHQCGRHAEALELIDRAIALEPGQAAEPNLWMSVTAPALAMARLSPACLSRKPAMTRWMMRSTGAQLGVRGALGHAPRAARRAESASFRKSSGCFLSILERG